MCFELGGTVRKDDTFPYEGMHEFFRRVSITIQDEYSRDALLSDEVNCEIQKGVLMQMLAEGYSNAELLKAYLEGTSVAD